MKTNPYWNWILAAVLTLGSLANAAETNSAGSFNLELQLADGSRLIGQTDIKFRALELASSSLGKLSVPLDKIRSIQIKTAEEEAIVLLQNGDQLKAIVQARAIDLSAIFGKVSVPMALIRNVRVQLSSASGAAPQILQPDDWESLPYPEDSDWPGNKGQPATIGEKEIVMLGQPIRTRMAFTAPITIECDVTLENNQDSSLLIRFVPPQQSKQLDVIDTLDCVFTRHGNRLTATAGVLRGVKHGAPDWSSPPTIIRADQGSHLRLNILEKGLRIDIDDQSFDVPQTTIPYENFHIQLWSWRPSDIVRVHNLRIGKFIGH